MIMGLTLVNKHTIMFISNVIICNSLLDTDLFFSFLRIKVHSIINYSIYRMADIYNYEGSKMGFITDTGPDTNGAQEFKKMEMMLRTMIDNISEVKMKKKCNWDITSWF